MIGPSSHITFWPKRLFSKNVAFAMLLMGTLCINYAFDFQAMNLESEIELVEGEDNQSSEEKNKKEKKEIELIQGTISSLCNNSRHGVDAYGYRNMKSEYIINIQTPPPELV